MVEMKNVVLGKGTLGTASANMASIAAGRTVIVKEIILTNVKANDVTADITIDGVKIVGGRKIYANDTVFFSLSAVIDAVSAAKTIQGLASEASAVNYYISGIEAVTVAD